MLGTSKSAWHVKSLLSPASLDCDPMFELAGHPASMLPPADLALRVLRLEQQLDSYQRLHTQELEDLRRALAQLKEEVLALAPRSAVTVQDHEE